MIKKLYNGDVRYYNDNDKIHRDDGPAIEQINGIKQWWLNGECHRVDGPAIEWPNGDKVWYLNNKCHRIDGPAIEFENYKKWYYEGKPIKCSTQQQFEKLIKLKLYW